MNLVDGLKSLDKNYPVFLSPLNELTLNLAGECEKHGVNIAGFIDSFKNGNNIQHPDTVSSHCSVIIFSPNYWEQIAANLDVDCIYICAEDSEEEFNLYLLENFGGYPVLDYRNKLAFQKECWEQNLLEYMDCHGDLEHYGFAWGDPENANDILGNYLAVLEKLQSLIHVDSTVLELGTLGGKWTKYLFQANKIICVDINSLMETVIKQRYPESADKFHFYVSSGDELNGIASDSIDLVFCIDTLVRSSKKIIKAYLLEISRILKKGAIALIHLPANEKPGSVERGFTSISSAEILEYCRPHFTSVEPDLEVLTHGVFLSLRK